MISEIPYQVNKARLIEKIAELAHDEKIRGIQDVRDESDRQGMRIVVDVKKGEPAQVVLNNLYKHTPLQDTFGVIMLAIVEQRPARAEPARGLRAVPRLPARRGAPAHRLRAAEGRGARPRPRRLRDRPRPPRRGDHADPRAPRARRSRTGAWSSASLSPRSRPTRSSKLQLQRLTGLERQKILDELAELRVRIADLKDILASPQRIDAIIGEELREDPARRTATRAAPRSWPPPTRSRSRT